MLKKYPLPVKTLTVSFFTILFCEFFFLADVMADYFHIDIETAWLDHGLLEFMTTITLAVSLVAIGFEIRRLLKENRTAQASVKVASGELMSVISQHFDQWQLSASERDIALLLIKGLSTQEVADLRQTKLGTVKSQSSAIYQKAGVRGRNELVAYFVEDLLAGQELLSRSATN